MNGVVDVRNLADMSREYIFAEIAISGRLTIRRLVRVMRLTFSTFHLLC